MNIAKIARSGIMAVFVFTYAGGLSAFHNPSDPFHTWDTTTSSGPSFGFDHRGIFTNFFLGDDRSNVRTITRVGGTLDVVTQTGIALGTTTFPDGSVEEGLWDVDFIFNVKAECVDPNEGDSSSTLRYSATCGQVATGEAFIGGSVVYNLQASTQAGLPPLSLCADPANCRIDILGPDTIAQCNALFGGENTVLFSFEESITNADNCGVGLSGVQIEPAVKTALYCHSADANPGSGFFLSACDADNPHTGSEVAGHEGLEPLMTISPNSVQVNCGGDEGNVKATLFGSPAFDISQVNLESLRLAGEAIALKKNGRPFVRFRDTDGDGFVDGVFTFESCPTIAAFLVTAPRNSDGTVTLTLTGRLLDGSPIIASADVRPVS